MAVAMEMAVVAATDTCRPASLTAELAILDARHLTWTPLSGNYRRMPTRLHHMHLLAAVAEQVLDLAAVLRCELSASEISPKLERSVPLWTSRVALRRDRSEGKSVIAAPYAADGGRSLPSHGPISNLFNVAASRPAQIHHGRACE
jgi:hypothetical protein